ncbi:MAG TPA: hypothetical protein VLL05_16610, partial [Terriglobales bacterium]|nr:hypothetical protein [Terriglobales bacterium]
MTILWGKLKNKWDNAAQADSGDAASSSRHRGDVEYLASGEGPDMNANPITDPAAETIYMSLTGLPLSMKLHWPFHHSTSGADFWVLHAHVRLEGSGLVAPVAVNMSATVREVFSSLEPKDTEGPIINAIRKEVDRRQLEFVKSGKLVPLQFSSRHYDFKRNQWAFGKADDATIRTFLERKIYWQTKLRGGDVWLGDATEAQYLQTTTDHLAEVANQMAAEGLIKLERRYATALPSLMARAEEFE